ncbi:uncharacterized protein LOC131858794 [Cryptomeria japonica]|uniref:uncharacterized protein LOC131858794 n=1 Tax=Cryptomeria japonica TaxID=3369 RepID=UPI0027DA3508|nr:uncharacterized protein LOC131858794 [Cryptomeria japonica]
MKWLPPKKGFVKLNFDGAYRGNPGKSRVGVCIRDWLGNVKAYKFVPIPPGTNNIVEALALFEGIWSGGLDVEIDVEGGRSFGNVSPSGEENLITSQSKDGIRQNLQQTGWEEVENVSHNDTPLGN